MNHTIDLEKRYCAQNYAPLPVVLVGGKGVYVWDEEGKRYLDMMSAYSAISLGHCHPRIVRMLEKQAEKLGVVSRAFYTDNLGSFLKVACELTGMDMALPMNSGTEAVETALKAARKWAYSVKGVTPGKAEIIACDGNFHGRSISIVAMSSEVQYRDGFGPFPPGFVRVPYGDAAALEAAITPDTAAFLVEPIQGEGGIIVPPAGYLADCARICKANNVLLFTDEIQTGLGRTGKLLASWHEDVSPDGLMLGKALSGGMLPVSLFLARKDVMDVFTPGDHGSTFGGNPLSAAVGLEALHIIVEDKLADRAAESGAMFMRKLRQLTSPLIRDVRGKGLLIGMELKPGRVSARAFCEHLMCRGILSKDTHGTVVRFAPPLVITPDEINWAAKEVKTTLTELEAEAA